MQNNRAASKFRTALSKPSALSAPYVGWLAVFVVAPILLVVVYAFSKVPSPVYYLTRETGIVETVTRETVNAELQADDSLIITVTTEDGIAYPESPENAISLLSQDNTVLVVSRADATVVMTVRFEGGGFTFDNFGGVWKSAPVFLRSFWLAFISTVICLVLGYPLAYILARETRGIQRAMNMLIMLPMWMNFLLRTYAWMSILENTGLLNRFLSIFGIAPLHIINTQTAVVIGMVYNFLPFMVLPLYSVIVKIDRHVIEAAQDLGAGAGQVFRRVIFPLSLPGVLSGVTMVFVPAVSTFAISKLLGGGMSNLLGDLIERNFRGNAYNLELGSAIALVMMVVVMVFMYFVNRFGDGTEGAVMM
jgi:spermidine/putrescine transport system permease protein